ncbi:helix-hairpin-helix domain-containing protein [Candidatus Entotheonella palauensis]|uniref:helix-hairpin-helix domain-containing protein n=1 Tax=Candidatus Entotheonella palauensis TaxID=93172 RepID=UPI000B7FD734|nr:helix-hairpin-helix domain-containing protein [Candidatus Entotheonella palauensis]
MEILRTYRQNHPDLLRTLGIAAVAAVAGGIGGMVLSKVILSAKGATVAHAALAAKGGGGSATVGEAAKILTPSTLGTSWQNATSFMNQTVTRGVSLSDKVTALLHTLSRNSLPLATGAAGGGLASLQMMKRRVHNVQDALNDQVAQTEAAQTEAARLQSELAGAETHLSDLQSRLDFFSMRRPSAQNPLTQIQGIGPVLAERLNAAGIYTFAELAAQTPESVRDIIGTTRGGAMFDPEAWIAAARQLADPS